MKRITVPGDPRMGRATLRDDDQRPRHGSTIDDAEPADAQYGDWPRERLVEMDQRFRERLERALRRGTESPTVSRPR
jgi:hypothetical protein